MAFQYTFESQTSLSSGYWCTQSLLWFHSNRFSSLPVDAPCIHFNIDCIYQLSPISYAQHVSPFPDSCWRVWRSTNSLLKKVYSPLILNQPVWHISFNRISLFYPIQSINLTNNSHDKMIKTNTNLISNFNSCIQLGNLLEQNPIYSTNFSES